MAVETHAQVRADERAAQKAEDERLAKAGIKDEKVLSPEEKADKELKEKHKKLQEDRTKLVDDTVTDLQTKSEEIGDPRGVQAVMKDVADKVAKTQVIAAGAQYGPSTAELEKQVFPIVAPPLADGTPVAHIGQVEKKEENDTAKPKDHGVAAKK